MEEIWKDIIGYEGLYQVSNLGRVRMIEPKIVGQGGDRYKSVWLKKNGKKNYCSVHRLVAQAFIPNPLNKKTVNHKNGNKKDNRVDNLEWATCSENIKHAFTIGLRGNHRKWCKVMQIKGDKVIFVHRSIKSASIFNNLPYEHMRKIVYGNNNEYNGYIWKLISLE